MTETKDKAAREKASPPQPVPPGDPVRRFRDLYESYLRDVQSAWEQPEARTRLNESMRQFASTYQDVWSPEERQERLSEAYGQYVRAAQEAMSPEDIETRSEAAYKSYVRAARDAWNASEAETLEPAALYAIAETIAAAAWSMGAAREAIRRRWELVGSMPKAGRQA